MLALLLATLVGYLCIGSLCFSALESETEQQRWEEGKARVGCNRFFLSSTKFWHFLNRTTIYNKILTPLQILNFVFWLLHVDLFEYSLKFDENFNLNKGKSLQIEAFVQDMVEGKSSKNATEYSEDLTILVRKLADEG